MLVHIHQLHIQNADWIQNHTTNAVRHTLTIPYIAPNPIVWILLSFSLCLSLSYTEGLSLSLFIRLQFSLYLAASVLRSLSNLPHSCCSPLSSLSSHRCRHSVLTSNSDCLSQKKIFITYNLQSQNFQTTHAILLLQQTSKSTLVQTSAYYDR